MKTCSCHSWTTNPTRRLIWLAGGWFTTVRVWRIIAWEELSIIRFLWSSPHHKKTVFHFLVETWPWSWRYVLKLGYYCDLFWPLVCAYLKAKQLKCHLTALWSFITYTVQIKSKHILSCSKIHLRLFRSECVELKYPAIILQLPCS
jgi:hypothetical protein